MQPPTLHLFRLDIGSPSNDRGTNTDPLPSSSPSAASSSSSAHASLESESLRSLASSPPPQVGPFTTYLQSSSTGSDLASKVLQGLKSKNLVASDSPVKTTITQKTDKQTGQPYVHVRFEQPIKLAGGGTIIIDDSGTIPGGRLEQLPNGGINIITPDGIKPQSQSEARKSVNKSSGWCTIL